MGGDVAGASCQERAVCEATRAIASEGRPGAEAKEGGQGGAEGGEQGSEQGGERGGAQRKTQGRLPRVLTKAILEVIPFHCTSDATRILAELTQVDLIF